MLLVKVLIEHAAHALNRPFSYTYNGKQHIEPGVRVLVMFNHKELVAYVLSTDEVNKSVEELSNDFGYNVQEIIKVIDETRILNDELISLASKISSYYLSPEISVLQTMLPPSLKPRTSSFKAPKIAYEKFVVLNNESEDELTPKQIEMLRFIALEKKVKKSELKSISILNSLLKKERVKIVLEEKSRLNIDIFETSKPKTLTQEQQHVVDEFINSEDKIYLLEGVTGSGKTEVYLSLSDYYLSKGKNILMLVPEISLTPLMVSYFKNRFKDQVAILHSELTPAEKYDEYRKIVNGKIRIVVGARSAVFAPLTNIGLIILDEEHVESYKQDVAPFYHARDVAIIRGESHLAKVLLGSATPSLESRARAQKNVYHLLRLSHRINNSNLPSTTIVDLSNPFNLDRESSIFSLTLRKEIKKALENDEQIILLLNRRGYSNYVSCRNCGHVLKCPNCDIALTYHKSDNMLKCHHCGYVSLMPDACPKCGSTHIMRAGFGTERVVSEINRLFPNARVLRLDSDSAKVRNKISHTIEDFRNKKADILVGTQMIAKGHDFPNVTLVGVVLADIGLALPSYRSSERTFELITQAIGRSGRADKKGKAIIQTYSPSHYAIVLAAKQDYESFYKKEMMYRKIEQYPPYTFLASISLLSKDEDLLIDTISSVKDVLKDALKKDAVILGPIAPYIPFESGFNKRVILIKYRNYEIIKPVLSSIILSLQSKSKISLKINIDPYDF